MTLPPFFSLFFGKHGEASGATGLSIDFSASLPAYVDTTVVDPPGLPAGSYRVVGFENEAVKQCVGDVVVGNDVVPGDSFYVFLRGRGGQAGAGSGINGGGGGGGAGLIVAQMDPVNTGETFTGASTALNFAEVSVGSQAVTAAAGGAGGSDAVGSAPAATTEVSGGPTMLYRSPAGGGGGGGSLDRKSVV